MHMLQFERLYETIASDCSGLNVAATRTVSPCWVEDFVTVSISLNISRNET